MRALGAQVILEHLPSAFPPGRGRDRGARRPPPVFGLGRPDPDRLGRFPGLLPAVTRARASTTTASRSARSTTGRRSGSRRRGVRDPAASRLRHRHVPRHLRTGGVDRGTCSSRPSGARAMGGAADRRPARAGPAALRHRSGGTDAELRRRSIEEIVALGFDGNALGGLAVGESREDDARYGRLGRSAAAFRQAALLHGARRHRGNPRRDRRRIDMFDCVLPTRTARTGSALTATGRINLHNARFTAIHGRSRTTAPALRASVLARVSPASRQPGRDPRIAPALTA